MKKKIVLSLLLLLTILILTAVSSNNKLIEELNQGDDVDNVIIGLVTLFALLFLFTMKKGGGDATPGRREPIKR